MPRSEQSLSTLIKSANKPKSKEPIWSGPCSSGLQGGVTQSLLAKYLVCKERFRIQTIEGLKPGDRFSHKMFYGNAWHLCEENLAAKKDWTNPLHDYAISMCRQYPMQQTEVEKWFNVCRIQFPLYVDFWARHKDVRNRAPIYQEQVFHVPLELPSGRTVYLRGKFDAVDRINDGVWIQEDKSKGNIDEQQIKKQMTFDLQTLLYATALDWENVHDEKGKELPADKYRFGVPIRGVRFNVIRRPLSGGKGNIVQRKGSKNVAAETKEEYYGRLAQYIKDEPETYFMRWEVGITQGDIARFSEECLYPVLENLADDYEWWAWCKQHGESVYNHHERHGQFTHHFPRTFRMPFGVYSPLLDGGATDLDEYLVSGDTTGLRRVETMFPELAPAKE